MRWVASMHFSNALDKNTRLKKQTLHANYIFRLTQIRNIKELLQYRLYPMIIQELPCQSLPWHFQAFKLHDGAL